MEKTPDYIPPKKVSSKMLAIVIVVIVIAAGAGIGAYLYLHPAKKESTLVVLVDSGGDTQQYLGQVAKNFEEENPGVKISIDSVGYSDLVSSSLSALKDKASSPGLIMYYPSGEPTLAPYLMNLSNDFNLSNYLPGELYSGSYVLNDHGDISKVVGMPIHTVLGYVMVYNTTILDNKTLDNGFNSTYHFSINPDTYKNWTAVYDAASYIQTAIEDKSLSNASNIKYSLMMPDSSHHAMIDAYISLLYSYGNNHTNTTGIAKNSGAGYWTYIYNDNGKYAPTFNNIYGVQALNMYKNLTDFEPSITSKPIGYDEQETYFESGEYAMGLAWTSFLPGYSNSSISKVAGNYGVSILPDNSTGYASTYMGVNPYTNTSLAIKFLKFALSDKEYTMGIDKYHYVPGTISGLKAAESNENFTWVKAMVKSASSIDINKTNVAIYDKLQSLFTTLTPDLNDEIYDYFTSTPSSPTTATQALSTAAKDWNEVINN